ncbi:peptidoglycan-binding domain-containing protein [Sabulicella rubraurantiaca]|uniref:peptidoglycan-binding domain-containing protein n=1 Tax=Sabulicella rubraurantiaca TaxID=2811429 RepID=UPI001A95E745|nr:peptidoglycan-binding protein [Sabulicella rubraurantiaca]
MQCSRALIALLAMAPVYVGTAHGQTPPALVYTHHLSTTATASVQEKLRQAGIYNGRADGVWGPESQAALERFQQTRNLQVTGQLNQATVATLGIPPADLLASGPLQVIAPGAAPPGPNAAEPLSPAVIRNVQQRLRILGFYRGAVDGMWGAGTQAAIERFQQGRGLQATGQVNPATIQALGLDPNNPAIRPR